MGVANSVAASLAPGFGRSYIELRASSSAASARVPVFMFFSLIYELASAAPGTRTGYAVDLGSLALDRCHLAQVSIITYLIEDYLFRKKGKRSRIECGGNKINLS